MRPAATARWLRARCWTAPSLFGLEKLTCGLPGFVKCTAEMLTGSLVEMLPPAMTVLEIVDAANGPPELLDACRNLKAAGYRLALDQSIWDPRAKPFVAIADYLKVDFLRTNPRERQTLRGQVGDTMAALVAEKVETQEQFRAARTRDSRWCRVTTFAGRWCWEADRCRQTGCRNWRFCGC